MRITIAAIVALLLVSATLVLAQRPDELPQGARFALPENARALDAQGELWDLGTKKDPSTNEMLQGYAIVHYDHKDNNSKSASARPPKPGGSTCYGFIADGAKRKGVENWVINTTNNRGLDSQSLFDITNNGISLWEDANDGTIGNGGINVFGNGSISTQSYDLSVMDGVNSVVFGTVDSPGAIAVTIVRGVFGGPTRNRDIREWDQIYDTTDFDRSIVTDPNKMSFPNIATHEIGHAFGLADLYTSSCAEETMYGYAGNGEDKKVSLNAGDLVGMDKLY